MRLDWTDGSGSNLIAGSTSSKWIPKSIRDPLLLIIPERSSCPFLRERIMPHPQVQSNLSDRYILNPSQIYSTMRLSADKQHYTLPVDAGWVVIGVVCHKGEIKVTQRRKTADTDKNGKRRGEADGAKEEEDDDDDDDHDLGTDPSKRRKTQNGTSVRNPTSSLRKFITLKICSLPPRNAMHSATQGDAILNLMLFEADCADTIPGETGEPSKKIYRGGSGGAYETWWKLAVGAVVGVVSPKILKPFGVSSNSRFLLPYVLRDIDHLALVMIGWEKGTTPSDPPRRSYTDRAGGYLPDR
jgi:minichromosome maintenance protein 10